jgi:NADP-reducing hydrogenase subunit HndB
MKGRKAMEKLTVQDLMHLKEKAAKDTYLREGNFTVKITVHMGTCGIAAGAREVMSAVLAELSQADRQDIQVLASGCPGTCSSEPNVTVEFTGHPPVTYKNMDPDKMRRVFQSHILNGEVQTAFVLATA